MGGDLINCDNWKQSYYFNRVLSFVWRKINIIAASDSADTTAKYQQRLARFTPITVALFNWYNQPGFIKERIILSDESENEYVKVTFSNVILYCFAKLYTKGGSILKMT